MILDLGRVTGLDATAVSTCFQPLMRVAQEHGVVLVIAAASSEVTDLLRRQDVLAAKGADGGGMRALAFDSLEESAEWCEEALIVGAQGTSLDRPQGAGISATLAGALAHAMGHKELADLEAHFEQVEVRSGGEIYAMGAEADAIFVVNRGAVQLLARDHTRIMRCGCGAFVGDMDFLLERPRTFKALAVEDCVLWRLSRAGLQRLLREQPQLGAELQVALMQGLALKVRDVLLDSILDD